MLAGPLSVIIWNEWELVIEYEKDYKKFQFDEYSFHTWLESLVRKHCKSSILIFLIFFVGCTKSKLVGVVKFMIFFSYNTWGFRWLKILYDWTNFLVVKALIVRKFFVLFLYFFLSVFFQWTITILWANKGNLS